VRFSRPRAGDARAGADQRADFRTISLPRHGGFGPDNFAAVKWRKRFYQFLIELFRGCAARSGAFHARLGRRATRDHCAHARLRQPAQNGNPLAARLWEHLDGVTTWQPATAQSGWSTSAASICQERASGKLIGDRRLLPQSRGCTCTGRPTCRARMRSTDSKRIMSANVFSHAPPCSAPSAPNRWISEAKL